MRKMRLNRRHRGTEIAGLDSLRRDFPVAEWPSRFCLFFDRAEREHGFGEDFVEHLGQPGVHGGEAADDSFAAGKLFEAGVFGAVTNASRKKRMVRETKINCNPRSDQTRRRQRIISVFAPPYYAGYQEFANGTI